LLVGIARRSILNTHSTPTILGTPIWPLHTRIAFVPLENVIKSRCCQSNLLTMIFNLYEIYNLNWTIFMDLRRWRKSSDLS
jgi:hypothetical protein